jgi:GTP cyclohydrolase I
MAAAVRTILECIGEDPDREGLLRTPDRYAQALMWMTRGYEERLAGTAPCSSRAQCACC